MYASKGVTTSHEDLLNLSAHSRSVIVAILTLSKAVEHALGWVSTKTGFCDILKTLEMDALQTMFQVLHKVEVKNLECFDMIPLLNPEVLMKTEG